MAGELFKQMAHIDVLHVPYKGSSSARIDVIGGQVDMMFDATTTMLGLIQGGKVKALATTGSSRSAVLPDVPTMAEAGVPGYSSVIWLGVMAPVKTPPDIINKLNAEITRIAGKPEIRAAWAKDGALPLSMDPEQFRQFLNDDIKKWAEVVRISGAKVDQ
jgi:tripartite-type tricarboxylate transporter receptor subunit TctC